jgi:hypothetical protein
MRNFSCSSTILDHQYQMKVSGQLHAPLVYPLENISGLCLIGGWLGHSRSGRCGEEKLFLPKGVRPQLCRLQPVTVPTELSGPPEASILRNDIQGIVHGPK